MKLFRFNNGRIGATRDGISWDLTEALELPQTWPPIQMVQLIADFERRMHNIFDHPAAKQIKLDESSLQTPIEWPNKLLAFPDRKSVV